MVESISADFSAYNSGDKKILEEKLQTIKDKQGILGSIWNDIKETTKLGKTESQCETLVKKFENGSVTFDQALEYIEQYQKAQDSGADLLANIAAGIGSIAVATTTLGAGTIAWGAAFAKGAPIGALLKSSIKTLDRATNNIENDELDTKTILKDAVSGSITGATSAVSSGISAGVKTGQLGVSVVKGAKCSAICGALSGSTSYMTDVALDDKEFDIGDLAFNTASNAFVSGTVGAAVGGGFYGANSIAGNVAKNSTKDAITDAAEASISRTIAKDSFLSSTRKVLGKVEKDALSGQTQAA